MQAVAIAAMAYDGATPAVGARRPSARSAFEEYPIVPSAWPAKLGVLGGAVDNLKVGIVWGQTEGIEQQGERWEQFVSKETPGSVDLPHWSKAFDHVTPRTLNATSSTTLDPLTGTYVRDPRQIFYRLKKKIDDVADYKFNEARKATDLDSVLIDSKTIQLGIRDVASFAQWREVRRAAAYAHVRGVEFIVTRIRDHD